MNSVYLRTLSDPDRIGSVIDILKKRCQAAGLNAQETYRLSCAVVEGFNNVIEHAYHGQAGQPVELHWTRDDDRITVEIRDWGDSLPAIPGRVPPSADAEHGRGCFIMRQWLNAVEYERVDGCNRLRLIRHLPR